MAAKNGTGSGQGELNMGIRGELYSTKVMLTNRTYFFNVKENRLGDLYLNIVESKNRDEGGFERQSLILFADDLQDFLSGFDESLKVMEKAVREKRRGIKKPPQADDESGDPGNDGKYNQKFREEKKPGNFYERERVKDRKSDNRKYDNRKSDNNKFDNRKFDRNKFDNQKNDKPAWGRKPFDSNKAKPADFRKPAPWQKQDASFKKDGGPNRNVKRKVVVRKKDKNN